MSIEAHRMQAFEMAIFALLVERPDLKGEQLLAAAIEEFDFSLARLREKGMILPAEEWTPDA